MKHEECHELFSSLSDYLDGKLDSSLCAEIEKHMAECERCRIVLNTLTKTVSLYQTSSASVKAPDAVRVRLFKRLDLDDFIEK